MSDIFQYEGCYGTLIVDIKILTIDTLGVLRMRLKVPILLSFRRFLLHLKLFVLAV